LRIKKEYIPNTTFKIKLEHYEFTVLPFGLTNAPRIFMSLMNEVFCKYLDTLVHVFIEDILLLGNNTLRTSKLGLNLHADHDLKEITFNLPPQNLKTLFHIQAWK
jgi:hypothetical protein